MWLSSPHLRVENRKVKPLLTDRTSTLGSYKQADSQDAKRKEKMLSN